MNDSRLQNTPMNAMRARWLAKNPGHIQPHQQEDPKKKFVFKDKPHFQLDSNGNILGAEAKCIRDRRPPTT